MTAIDGFSGRVRTSCLKLIFDQYPRQLGMRNGGPAGEATSEAAEASAITGFSACFQGLWDVLENTIVRHGEGLLNFSRLTSSDASADSGLRR